MLGVDRVTGWEATLSAGPVGVLAGPLAPVMEMVGCDGVETVWLVFDVGNRPWCGEVVRVVGGVTAGEPVGEAAGHDCGCGLEFGGRWRCHGDGSAWLKDGDLCCG